MSSRHRAIVSLVAVVPVLGMLMVAVATSLPVESPEMLACHALPSGIVPPVSTLRHACNLHAYDRIVSYQLDGEERYLRDIAELRPAAARAGSRLAVTIDRNGREQTLAVPVVRETTGYVVGRIGAATLLSGVVLTMALLILWRANAAAAIPFLLFYGAVSMGLIAALCGPHSEGLYNPGEAASAMVPATLAHLALTFPRPRDLVRRIPALASIPYVLMGIVSLISTVSFDRFPDLWVTVNRLVGIFSLVALGFVILGCVLGVRESVSALERARAKVLLYGTCAVTLLPIVGLLLSRGSLPSGLALAIVTVSFLPLPIGYAIARYHLFDLALDVRRVIAYALYLATIAGLGTLACLAAERALDVPVPLEEPTLLFTVLFAGMAAIDPVRARLWGLIETWASTVTEDLRRLAGAHAARMAEPRDPSECGRLLAETVDEALRARGVAVFLTGEGAASLCHAIGREAVLDPRLAGAASRLCADLDLVHLAREDTPFGSDRHRLLASGVEVVVALRSGSEDHGTLLVGRARSDRPYSTPYLDFLRAVSAQTAVAIHNASLTRDLLLAERFATLGRVSAGLAHEIGKPLGALEVLGRRLERRLTAGGREQRDARTMADLATEMRSMVRDLLARSQGPGGPDGAARFPTEGAIEDAVQSVARSWGRSRIAVRLSPGLPRISGSRDRLARALSNLLENAVLASPPDEVVEIVATSDGRTATIQVIDRGTGMDPAVTRQAFEPFFTTRADGGGSGLGLVLVREAVDELGGTIRLESEPGRGTRVRIELPVAEPPPAGPGPGDA